MQDDGFLFHFFERYSQIRTPVAKKREKSKNLKKTFHLDLNEIFT
jgi:hypothetical protein